jgi:cytochrome c-type biogenesis protein CcmH/NrfF
VRLRRILALAMLVTLAAPAAASAAKCPKTSLADLEDEVMCLECKAPLAQSPDAPQAQRERVLIQSLVVRCESKSEIKATLVSQFGDRVLAQPPARGFNLTAYIVPGLAVLAALAAISVAAVRWRRRRPPGEPAVADGTSAGDSARLEKDLERYDL